MHIYKAASVYEVACYIIEVSKYDKSSAAFNSNSVSLAMAFVEHSGGATCDFVSMNYCAAHKIEPVRGKPRYYGFDTPELTTLFFEKNKAACLELMQEILIEKEYNDCYSYISSIVPPHLDDAEKFVGFVSLVNDFHDIKDVETIDLRNTFISSFVRDIYDRVHYSFWKHDGQLPF